MKRARFLLLVLSLFTLVYASAQQEVIREELEGIPTEGITFRNFDGVVVNPNTAAEIRGIGRALANLAGDAQMDGQIYRYGNKYAIREAGDQEIDGKLSAAILYVNPDALVENVRNLRLIISGYLEGRFGYSTADADLLAYLLTMYNAYHRGDIEFFSARYKPAVMSDVTAQNAGLALSYDQWPGQTRLFIPLTFGGNLYIPDIVPNPDDIDDQTRGDLADLIEDSLTGDQLEIDDLENQIDENEDKIKALEEERDRLINGGSNGTGIGEENAIESERGDFDVTIRDVFMDGTIQEDVYDNVVEIITKHEPKGEFDETEDDDKRYIIVKDNTTGVTREEVKIDEVIVEETTDEDGNPAYIVTVIIRDREAGNDNQGSTTDPKSGDQGSTTDPKSGDQGSTTDPKGGDQGSTTDPKGGDQGSTTDPKGGDQGSTTDPKGGDQGSTTDPKGGDQGSTTDPKGGDQGSTTDPKGGDQGSTTDPKSGDQGSTTDPKGGDQGSTTDPKSGDQGSTTDPKSGDQGSTTDPKSGDQGSTTDPKSGDQGSDSSTDTSTLDEETQKRIEELEEEIERLKEENQQLRDQLKAKEDEIKAKEKIIDDLKNNPPSNSGSESGSSSDPKSGEDGSEDGSEDSTDTTDDPTDSTDDPASGTDPNGGDQGSTTNPTDPKEEDQGSTTNPTNPANPGNTQNPTDPNGGDQGSTTNPTNPANPGNTQNPTNPTDPNGGDQGSTTNPTNPGNTQNPTEPPKPTNPNPDKVDTSLGEEGTIYFMLDTGVRQGGRHRKVIVSFDLAKKEIVSRSPDNISSGQFKLTPKGLITITEKGDPTNPKFYLTLLDPRTLQPIGISDVPLHVDSFLFATEESIYAMSEARGDSSVLIRFKDDLNIDTRSDAIVNPDTTLTQHEDYVFVENKAGTAVLVLNRKDLKLIAEIKL
ncbi:P83/100 family protein [Entomospira culicis]|uniref:Uncharacterized protein n=1 Tax=Entomospira culicis TaxID=2719989 RepID=A0A968GGA0_9SPIO|nr:P83/100 family protein [Entomospira culicis]NIZ19755.1 hypothetical protein [Entomospira culicis]NIZ69969.1 hypothetical protein [Entomospira culicis]WDI37074.1 P83/100 family protein [Entomospira culicis]WDI38703.1 P83/100 family protein [Entomospira culicis]